MKMHAEFYARAAAETSILPCTRLVPPQTKCKLGKKKFCQHEQSLRDNLIVFFFLSSTSAVFDVSGMVAIEQTIIFLISSFFLATYHACDIPLKLPDQTLNSI